MPHAKIPSGYFSMADVAKHVRKRVDEYWKYVSAARQIERGQAEAEFKDALVTYLVEYLIWQFKASENSAISETIRLWHNNELFELSGYIDQGLTHDMGRPNLDEILFKSDISLLDFVGRDDNPLVFSSTFDEELFADYVSSRQNGYDFVDALTWSILDEPRAETQTALALTEAERLLRQETWERVKPFSGAVIVCSGRSASKIADRALRELKKFRVVGKLPENEKWRKRQIEWAVERYLEMPPEEQEDFALKPKQNFAEWLTGNSEASDHRAVKEMWCSFLNLLPKEYRDALKGKGRRPQK